MSGEWITLAAAARMLGVHSTTVRRWADEGQLTVRRVNARGDRRVSVASVDALLRDVDPDATRREALYVRVSGRGDQMTSLAAQEQELRASSAGDVVHVFSDVGSGLNERRRGLNQLLDAAQAGAFDVVRVTHADRLTRLGSGWIERLLAAHNVTVEVLHEQGGSPEQELMEDFMALIASFSGRLYGQRSAAARKRLLERAAQG